MAEGIQDRDKELLSFVQSVRAQLVGRDPLTLARNTGTTFDAEISGFEVTVLGRDFVLPYPSFVAREAAVEHHEGSAWVQALLIHYFRTADGTPLQHRWISFRELPGGMLYEKAFQSYTGDKLAKAFGNDLDRFSDACRRLRADRAPLGDVSYLFRALPQVLVLVAYWAGDEEFPPTAKMLFDESACHYLPTDAYAALGSRLCNTVLHAAGLLDETGPAPD
ncbi:MAG: DUF3786 domain-containing protein [Chloroflexi bacterium]|nr:DUF3786 domain-containing protein [Chloroflexota bacterium]